MADPQIPGTSSATNTLEAATETLLELFERMGYLRDPEHARTPPEIYFRGPSRFAYDAALLALRSPPTPISPAFLISRPVDPSRTLAIHLLQSEIQARRDGAYAPWARGECTRWTLVAGLWPASPREFRFLPETIAIFHEDRRKVVAAFRPVDECEDPVRALEAHGLRALSASEMAYVLPHLDLAMDGAYASPSSEPDPGLPPAPTIIVRNRRPGWQETPDATPERPFLLGIVQ